MSNVRDTQLKKIITSSPSEMGARNSDVRVVVVMDGMTRSSVATIRKEMSSAVKRDLSILKRFGLTSE